MPRPPYLPLDEEYAIVRRAQANDQPALRQLISRIRGIIAEIAHKWSRTDQDRVEDIIQWGLIGMVEALPRFDFERGLRFNTYAMSYAMARMRNYVLANCGVYDLSGNAKCRHIFWKMPSVLKQHRATVGGEASDAVVARALSVPERHVALVRQQLQPVQPLIAIEEVESTGARGHVPVANVDTEAELAEAEAQALIKQRLTAALGRLNRRQRYIVRQRYLIDDPRSLDAVGRSLGISRERVRQIEVKALKMVRHHLVIGGLTRKAFRDVAA